MSSPKPTSRRAFLRNSVALGTAFAMPTIVPSSALGRDGTVAPSEKITLGVIGIGPRCTYDLTAMLGLSDIQCVAIADVQQSRRDAGKKLVDAYYGNQSCVLYRDFRELLDRKDIDAVIVATGDRWHAPASIMAAKAGKDVYSEKPCGLTIENCQQLADTMQATGRVFQAGTQRRSVPNFQQAVELAHSGKLGKLHTLYASVYEPAIETTWLPGQPTPPRDVCDWNLWLGPAPWRPYNKLYVDGRWRGYYDFDSGAKLLDWGAHRRSLSVGQPGGRHDADRVCAERQGHHLPLCQRCDAGPGLPGDTVCRASRLGAEPWHLSRCGSSARKVRSKRGTAAISS